MSERPTLALLIPAYNAEAWLPRLLASAAAQTEPFDQVWVYDDASSDGTASIARQWGAKVIGGEANVGCSVGKNILANRTDADWLHFHDADDDLLPNFVSLARRWMADGRQDVVLFGYEERDQDSGKPIARRVFDPAEVARDPKAYAILHQINPFCGLYRREAFLAAGGYDEDPRVLFNEDVAMHVRLAFAGLSFAAETEVGVVNYRRSESMSGANPIACAQAHLNVLSKTAELPGADVYASQIAFKLWRIAGVLAAYLDWPNADSAATLARKLAPATTEGSGSFRALAALSPPLALRVREHLIRAIRPGVRAAYPRRSPIVPNPGQVP